MTFTVPRKPLDAELALLQAVAERKATIPVLTTVMLGMVGDTLTLTATDLDTTLITDVAASGDPWGGCVPSKQLYDLARLLDGDDVTFTPQDNRLGVSWAKSKHKLPTLAATEFPEIERPAGVEFSLSLPLLQQMITATAFALLEPATSYSPADLKFTGLSLRAKDGRLEAFGTCKVVTAIAETQVDAPPFTTIIPRSAVEALLRLEGETVSVIATPNGVQFTAGPRTLITRPLLGEFPDWRLFVPDYQWQVMVNSDVLTDAVRRASVTMGTDNAIGYEAMKATFTADELSIETRGGASGKSEEPVTITSNMNGDALSIGVINKQLLSVLAKCEGDVQCHIIAANRPLMFTPQVEGMEVRYIIMPIGLKW